jgi:hypothetical protein
MTGVDVMTKSNQIEKDSNQNILFYLEFSEAIPVRFEDGKFLGRLDSIQWNFLLLLARAISNVITKVSNIEGLLIQCEPYERDENGFLRPGVEGQIIDSSLKLDDLAKKKVMDIAQNFLHHVSVANPHQEDAFINLLKLDVDIQKSIINEAQIFLKHNGGKPIATPITFRCQDVKCECKGALAPKPPIERLKSLQYSVVAEIDGFRLKDRTMYLIGPDINKDNDEIIFDVDKFKGQVKQRAGDSCSYRLLLVKGEDAKGNPTLTLLDIGDKVDAHPDLLDSMIAIKR